MNLGNYTLEQMSVNYADLVAANDRYQALIASLSTRDIRLGTSWDPEAAIENLMTQFQDFTVAMSEQQ